MVVDIFSVPLSKLNNITPVINAEILETFTRELPQYFKFYTNYWLVNTNLTIISTANQPNLQIFNVFLQYASFKSPMLQITKN